MQEAKTNCSLLQLSIFVLSLLLGATKLSVQPQSLPPARSDGFVYSGHRADSDAILIEAFFDPVCPDSRDSWPPLKQAVQSYGSRVSVVIHLLPLPYHDNSFAACRALHIVNALNSNATFKLLDWFYKYQEKFYNAQTRNLSREAVVIEMTKFASEAIGKSYSSAIGFGFSDSKTDLKTRVSFKYSASKGVFGTPTFYVNGFALPDASVPTDEKGWRRLIDSLISQQGKQSESVFHYY